MPNEAILAKSEVLFLHFNDGNVVHHEEFICRISHGRDFYAGTPEYEERLRHVDWDLGL